MKSSEAMVAEFAMTLLCFPQPNAQAPACNPRPSDDEKQQKPTKSPDPSS